MKPNRPRLQVMRPGIARWKADYIITSHGCTDEGALAPREVLSSWRTRCGGDSKPSARSAGLIFGRPWRDKSHGARQSLYAARLRPKVWHRTFEAHWRE